ncbi:cucumber peeling cupredoxin [Phtheirospermum japonicum]|uniref:Cucumber peeling cupredoxin n=1 Tax=Phtheirospermum japonicum TaxID=374723 RepID=A0A830C0G6_9LAMI|nr:cucumber peeling cupredoxin [Phtheirospermum japonicum]
MDRFSCLIVLCAVFGVLVHYSAAQNVHVVGDEMGWDIPSNASVSYNNWVSGRTFMVGDILVFNFVSNQHDVVRVPQASYTACSQDNAIGDIITTGPVNITLNSAGDHYYICTLGGHCNAGQRLAITVVSSTPGGTANPPATPATPSPASAQPDACAPTSPSAGGPGAAMVPPALPNSASTSLAAAFLLMALSTGIAFIFERKISTCIN